MGLNEYQDLASRTMNLEWTMYETELHALHGISSEVGEIHGLYQKVFQGHKMDKNHLLSEIGDAMWFIAELCTANGFTLEEVAQHNIDKLKARYPEGFDAEKSLHRMEGDI